MKVPKTRKSLILLKVKTYLILDKIRYLEFTQDQLKNLIKGWSRKKESAFMMEYRLLVP